MVPVPLLIWNFRQGEGICIGVTGPWTITGRKIQAGEKKGPFGLLWVQLLRGFQGLQIFMVLDHSERMMSPL